MYFSKLFLGQAGDSRFEGRDRVKYTREQILELREVIQFCNAVYIEQVLAHLII